ncbi:MAG: hypothetical protein HY899_02055 [Deltaproteobacteria bacterium]|nr:hypothetical protein [Deltaproteobacteria bacterium]
MSTRQGVNPRRPLRRRDFLKLGVAVLAGYALLKVGARAVIGAKAPVGAPLPDGLKHLQARHAAILSAAAVAIVGPAGEAAYRAGRWQPARDADAMIEAMYEDQRGLVRMALNLLEESTWGMMGFSGLEPQAQQRHLASWACSSLALERSVWGMLHALSCSSFSGTSAGWEVMGYPGPCLKSAEFPGRPPGQSATFEWDARVP